MLAEISAKKPSYSRHARLTVDGALPRVRVVVRVMDSFGVIVLGLLGLGFM